mgnify:CR=1 FL=1
MFNELRRQFLVDCKYSTIDITKYDSFYSSQKCDDRVYFDEKQKQFYLPWVFSKCFDHGDSLGFATVGDLSKLFTALKNPTMENIEKIALAPTCKNPLVYPFSGHSFNLIGMDSSSFDISGYDQIDSMQMALDMSEVYVMSLKRNTTFMDLVSNQIPYVSDFSNYKDQGYHSIALLHFRGARKNETHGPYISQFLYHPILVGGMHIEQRFKVDDPFETNEETWLQMQNSSSYSKQESFTYKYLHTPQVLASAVHYDTPYQFYYNACLIAIQNGVKLHGFWTSGGVPSLLASVAHVSLGVLRTAWYLKWGILRIRPEEYAHRINISDQNIINNTPGLLNMITYFKQYSPTIINDQNQTYGNLLLNCSYQEGSPNHPSFPSGHACIAAACVTVMKAMFVLHDQNMDHLKWNGSVLHSINGETLVNFAGSTSNLTIIGELNKLVSNVSFGRQWAGVHYTTDSECGIQIGEKYAERYLMDIAVEFYEKSNGMFKGWILEKFDGTIVKITHKEIIPYTDTE